MSPAIYWLLIKALGETIYMVGISSLMSILLGLPIGVILFTTNKNGLLENRYCYSMLAMLINATRSVPFIILLVAITPLTEIITGTSIGTTAAIVPLTVGAVPFVSRIIENAFYELPSGLLQAGLAMGASPLQIISKILIPESLPGIIQGMTVVIVSLIGYSAMAGAIGGGGLGEVGINYGYQRFNASIMLITVVMLIILVQLIQWVGDKLANTLRKK